MLCSSSAGRDTDSMAKQPEKYMYLRAGPGLSYQFPWSRRASSPPSRPRRAWRQFGDDRTLRLHGDSDDSPGPARSTVYLRLLRGKIPQTHVRFWRFRHCSNGCVLHWRIWRPDLEVIGSVLRWGCQRHSRCDQTPNRPGVVKDSGAMVVPSREQPRRR